MGKVPTGARRPPSPRRKAGCSGKGGRPRCEPGRRRRACGAHLSQRGCLRCHHECTVSLCDAETTRQIQRGARGHSCSNHFASMQGSWNRERESSWEEENLTTSVVLLVLIVRRERRLLVRVVGINGILGQRGASRALYGSACPAIKSQNNAKAQSVNHSSRLRRISL